MSIIVSELFLSAGFTPLHRTLSGDTPERKHFPQPWPRQPPTNPDICSFTRPSRFRAPSHPPPHPSMSVKIDPFTGEQVGRFRQAPHLYPETHEFARRADCQRSCFTDWIGGGWGGGGVGGYDKDDSLCGGTLSAAATRNLFRKNRILYTMVVGVKKGGTY